MARTKAIAASKTVLSFQAGDTSGTAIPLAAIRTISYGGSKLSFIDVTNADSDGNYKEQIPAIFDGGEINVEGVYVSGEPGRLAMHTAYAGRKLCTFKIQLPLAPDQTTAGTPLPSMDISLLRASASTTRRKSPSPPRSRSLVL